MRAHTIAVCLDAGHEATVRLCQQMHIPLSITHCQVVAEAGGGGQLAPGHLVIAPLGGVLADTPGFDSVILTDDVNIAEAKAGADITGFFHAPARLTGVGIYRTQIALVAWYQQQIVIADYEFTIDIDQSVDVGIAGRDCHAFFPAQRAVIERQRYHRATGLGRQHGVADDKRATGAAQA